MTLICPYGNDYQLCRKAGKIMDLGEAFCRFHCPLRKPAPTKKGVTT